jgi:hypothetical protein
MRELFRGRRSGIGALGGRVMPSLRARRRSALELWFREVCQLAFRVPEVEDKPRPSSEQIAANEQKCGLADDFDAGARSR